MTAQRSRRMEVLLGMTLSLAAFGAAGPPAAERPQPAPVVWAVNDGEKVERDDLDNPNKTANSAWDGHKVKLFGARNELLAFQVIVEGGADGIRQLTAAMPELRLRGGRVRIAYKAPVADPTQYAGRPIQLFSVHYLNVTEPTR